MSDAIIQIEGRYQNVAANGDEKDWDADANRWTKGGNDRLYLNGCKFAEYVDLESVTVVSDHANVSPWDATAEINGNELTVSITAEGTRSHKEMSATFSLPEDLAEETDDEDNEPEVAADGGEDPTNDLTDKEIESAIENKDDPDHPDATTVEEVRNKLAQINHDVVEWWDEFQDAIDDGAHEIVYEDSDVVVLSDHSGHFWREQLDEIGVDGPLRSVIISLHHTLASKHCDNSWSANYPVVVQKTGLFRTGEKHLLREIARRTDDLGSVARAVDTLATEDYGWSKSNWARLTGRNPSTVTRTTDN